jgi:hypothetical protein
VSESLKLQVMGSAGGEPAGYDSTIIKVPGRWYADVDGGRAFVVQLAGRDLREGSESIAAGMGERLHHAEWTITSDPDEVRTLGLMHDCPTCRAGVDQALTFLRENLDGEVAVGQLWWAGP